MDKKLKKLLAEDMKKFRLLAEYDFFIPPTEEDEVLQEDDEELGDDDMFDEPEGGEPAMDAPEGGQEPEMGGEEEMSFDGAPIDPEMGDEPAPEMGDEAMPTDMEPEGDVNLGDDSPEPEMGGEDEVELDITELVDSTDAAKESSDAANDKIGMLMQKFADLESRLPRMDMIGKKIEDLQKDIELRNPTEVEKLEMRSMNSYPYNVKLTDFWDDHQNKGYDVTNGEGQRFKKEEEEYVLTKTDVNDTYSESGTKNSFKYTEEDM